MDALEQVRRRDVGHVEGRVLAQQHDVAAGQVLGARVGQLVVRADLVLDMQRLAAREQAVAVQAEVGRRVVEHVVPAPLRFQQDRERGIAADVDPLDRVHLAGDAQGHVIGSVVSGAGVGKPLLTSAVNANWRRQPPKARWGRAAASGRGTRKITSKPCSCS